MYHRLNYYQLHNHQRLVKEDIVNAPSMGTYHDPYIVCNVNFVQFSHVQGMSYTTMAMGYNH
jgi:hypothetical protein